MKTSPIASQTNAATATNAANGQNYAQTFTYDIIGNITNKSDVSAYTYGQTNYASPHAVTAAGGKTYAYDQNGNLTGDGTWTHAWDYKDRLLESTEQGSGNTDHVKYSYDETGTRITKENTTSGKKTTYVSDLLDIEAGTEKLAFFANGLKLATFEGSGMSSDTECTVPASGDWTVTANCTISSFKTASGNVTVNAGITLTIAPTGVLEINLNAKKLLVKNTGKVLIQQGGTIAQTGRLSPLPGGTTGGLIFHHADHLSGASVDTDTAGNVLQLTDYYPYGDSRIESTTTAFHNDYTYTGKERDEDTALLYYEARYYDSHLGRFISVDPWQGDINDPQSFNKYAYVRNNPLRYIDPLGLKLSDKNRKEAFKTISDFITSKAFTSIVKKKGNETGLNTLVRKSFALMQTYGEYEKNASVKEHIVDALQIFADAVAINFNYSLDSGDDRTRRLTALPDGLTGSFNSNVDIFGGTGNTDKLQHFANAALQSAKYGQFPARWLGTTYEGAHALTRDNWLKFDRKDIIANTLGAKWARSIMDLNSGNNPDLRFFFKDFTVEGLSVDTYFKHQ